ncbi:hypothetical protein NUU61_000425 [Penicillium alfredii]|uniref:GRF-type domain-containing protein n=1 Tax=Penicillium alfredii TaxID=1506179 RepID=A0A9W9G9T2_9EURO|nr:uncharacterized protein NUU61_000425 [Penicillium alfredii]KAJ5114666.1 hypothetical protein NUU61_000425 [Penicillium alfredii]
MVSFVLQGPSNACGGGNADANPWMLVNGIRNPFSYEPWRGTRTFESMFDILEADIVVLQETKIQRKDLRDDMVLVPGWDCYFSLPRVKKGESLCCSIDLIQPSNLEQDTREWRFTRAMPHVHPYAPKRALRGFSIGGYPTSEQLTRIPVGGDSDKSQGDENPSSDTNIDAPTLDSEGRCVILEFPAFVLIGVYCPAYRDESRDCFRMDFLNVLDTRVRNLEGIDAAHAMEAIRKGAMSEDEFVTGPSRRLFNHLLSDGVVVGERDAGREQPALHDICRQFHPGRAGMYTCWDQKLNARPGNYGSRIDYVLCSLDMRDWFSESNIQEGLMGSDHCPVFAVFKDTVPHEGSLVHIQDLVNPPGMFQAGKRQHVYTPQCMLPASGRLLAEFDVDKRRSIKDMFARKPPPTISRSASSVSASEKPPLVPGTESATASTSSTPQETGDFPASIIPENNQPAKSIPRKRAPPAPTPSTKRSKSVAVASSAASTPGQKSLKGFFKPKSVPEEPALTPVSTESTTILSQDTTTHSPKIFTSAEVPATTGASPPPESPVADSARLDVNPVSPPNPTDNIIDPVASKEDWTKLFTKKPVPRCDGHQEPCTSLTTKKPGINRGRSFWICSRPLGPSGDKERGTEWRCPTFIWASDWNSSGES